MPKNKCLFQAKSLDDPLYNQWLRKKSHEVGLCSYCKSCYVFNIWYSCFYFYISRYCTALLKAVNFIDLNPLGACIAEKEQSDEKISQSENKQSLIMWYNRDKWGAVSPSTGEISIFTLVFSTSYIKGINVELWLFVSILYQ